MADAYGILVGIAVIGMEGLPAPVDADNVLLLAVTARLSLRLSPTLDGAAAAADLGWPLQVASVLADHYEKGRAAAT